MDLKTYWLGLDPEGREAYAKRAGTTPGYLNLVTTGHRRASHRLAKALHKASNGKVPLSGIRPDIWEAA